MSSDTLEKQIENLTAFLMQFYLPRGEGARRKKDFCICLTSRHIKAKKKFCRRKETLFPWGNWHFVSIFLVFPYGEIKMEVTFFHPFATLFLNIYSSIYLCRLYLFSTTAHQRVFWAWLSIEYPWRYLYFSADTIATLIEMYVANIKYISPSGPHFIQLVSSLHPLSPLASCYCPSFHFPPLRSGEEGRPLSSRVKVRCDT